MHFTPCKGRPGKERLSKLLRKLTAFVFLIMCLHISVNGSTQIVSISGKKIPVEEVFLTIKKQTAYAVVCKSSVIKDMKPVDLNVKDMPLRNLMDLTLRNQGLQYTIGKNSVFIFPDSTAAKNDAKKNEREDVTRQQEPVTGKVTDSTGAPLPGVTVFVKGKYSTAVTTSKTGSFSIAVADGDVLVIYNPGFTTREIPVRKGQTLQVILKVPEKSLNEVIITGFQQLNKETFTGAVGKVDKALLQRSGVGDVSRMLQGAVAGVSVENVSSTFGSTPKIRIRGSASISANQEPLYVVDGVPVSSPANIQPNQLYSGDPAALLGSAIAGLNPADIEDIAILKDGSATSLYGTRAANGVVSITTKKGKKGQMTVNAGSALTLGIRPNVATFNLMDSKEQMELSSELYRYGYLSVLNYPSTTGAFTDIYNQYTQRNITQAQANELLNKARAVNTDWFKVLFRNNLVQEHNLSIGGGSEKATYFLSGSYLHDDGQAKGYNTNRYTANFRTVINVTKKLDLDFITNFTYRDQLTPGTFNSSTRNGQSSRNFDLNPFSYAVNTSRAMVPYDENGNYKYYLRDFAPFNVLNELHENFNTLSSTDIRTALKLTYKIIPGLTYETLMSARKTSADLSHVMTERSNVAAAYRVASPLSIANLNTLLYKDPNDPNAIPQTILPTGGILDQQTARGSFLTMRHALNWNHAFNRLHVVNVFGGFEIGSDKVNTTTTRGWGYQYYAGKIISPSPLALRAAIEKNEPYYTETFTRENKTAFFLNTNYVFDEKYIVDLAARVDGSNLFGSATKTRFLPNYSIGLAWNVSREKFMEQLNSAGKIDFLKVRGSYALRGNAWQSSPALNAKYQNYYRGDPNYDELGINILSPELYNLNWEKDYTTSVGIDVGVFNKITLTAEYYNRANKDLVASRNVSYEDGFPTKTINWASMTNKGIDVTLGIKDIVRTRDFHWNFNVLVGQVKNRLTQGVFSPLLTQKTSPTGYGEVGRPLNGLYAYRFAGLDNMGQPLFYGAKNNKYSNIVLSSQDDSLIAYQGSRDPTVTGSFTNSFNYKSFELRVFFTYSFGNKVFRNPIVSSTYDDNLATQKDVAARWRIPGDEKITNIPGLVSNIQDAYNQAAFIQREFAYNRSDLMVVNAAVLRLSEVTLSYDFVPKKASPLKMARLSLAANNLYFWADRDLRGVDPQSIISGVNLPNPTSYTLRLNAQF
ncbi:TonB-linked SusC/RagA family outer membrane protein [Chitinophaga polysaccharea]|uniref:TonB-linked SusC/RagA family outer membrane protein n=1 Tax=Chitinophaga polysaccharea TaxID=1293035 RepID=A0A561PTC9_9BACT|nr:SusC/RagA family TonB-linked outer membrane protein [Chitinophaga polysaccharea]TWF41370.1 TonB-linked SusC/RagA family outer membrane protein [Chitinophaga polysaccharea]